MWKNEKYREACITGDCKTDVVLRLTSVGGLNKVGRFDSASLMQYLMKAYSGMQI